MGHDFGYTFVFVNKNKSLTLDEYVMFDKLDNLKLTAADREISNDQPFWKFTVKPGEKVVKHLRKIIIDAGFSMSYQSTHEFLNPGEQEYSVKERHSPEKLTDKELIQILKLRGEKQKFK